MSTPITLTGAYTCTHHNDQQRAACPVCLIATLTTERDAARARAESAEREAFDWKKIARYEAARAERAELRIKQLEELK